MAPIHLVDIVGAGTRITLLALPTIYPALRLICVVFVFAFSVLVGENGI